MHLQSVIHDSISVMITFQNVKKVSFWPSQRRVYISLSNISVSHSVITVVQKFYSGKTSREKFLSCPASLYWRNIMRIHFTIFQLFCSKVWLKWKKNKPKVYDNKTTGKKNTGNFLGKAGQISAKHKNFR